MNKILAATLIITLVMLFQNATAFNMNITSPINVSYNNSGSISDIDINWSASVEMNNGSFSFDDVNYTFSESFWEYQENENATGVTHPECFRTMYPYTNAYDGNWGNYAEICSDFTPSYGCEACSTWGDRIIDFNYTRVNGTKAIVLQKGYWSPLNHTLPEDCVKDILEIRFYGYSPSEGAKTRNMSCSNGSNQISIVGTMPHGTIRETGIWFERIDFNGSILADLTPGHHNITVCAEDRYGNKNSTTVFFIIRPYDHDSESHTENITEGTSNTFSITFESDDDLELTAELFYNGTSQGYGTKSEAGYYTTFSKTIYAPQIESMNETFEFYWELVYTYDTGTETYNSSTHNQTVYQMILSDCTGDVTSPKAWIFNLKDEYTSAAVNGTMEAAFTVATDNVNRTYPFDFDANYTSYSICIYPPWAELTTDAMIEYDAGGYTPRNYFLDKAVSSNDTQAVTLYLLPAENATKITVHIQDNYETPLEDYYLLTQKYDIGTNTYKTVDVSKTNYNGDCYPYLELYEWYRFIVQHDGAVIKSFSPTQIQSTTITLTINTLEIGDFLYYENLAHSCTYNSVSTVLTCTVSELTGTPVDWNLAVRKRIIMNFYDICDVDATAASASLICNLTASGNATGHFYLYALTAVADGVKLSLESGEIDNGISAGAGYGDFGLIFALIIIITMTLAGNFHPAGSLLGNIIGIIISVMLGFIEIAFSFVLSLVFVAIIFIYKLRSG